MQELIDANGASALREVARSIRNHNRIHSKSERNAILITQHLDFAADVIDKMADGNIAIVRHGRWIKSDVYTFKKCSECGAIWDAALCDNIFFIYCPRCGSKNGGADNGY